MLFSIAVFSLIVRLYDYRSSADDFHPKLIYPRKVLRIKNSVFFTCFILKCLLRTEFLMTQPLYIGNALKRIYQCKYLFFSTLYAIGDRPYAFLKVLIKCEKLPYPQFSQIFVILSFVSMSIFSAL